MNFGCDKLVVIKWVISILSYKNELISNLDYCISPLYLFKLEISRDLVTKKILTDYINKNYKDNLCDKLETSVMNFLH